MSADEALIRLGQSTAEAVPRRARDVRPRQGHRRRGRRSSPRTPRPRSPASPVPAVAMSVSYVDGVTGGNVFLITLDGARKLAASMMGMDEPEDPDARRALRARAVRGLGGDEPDDGLGGGRDLRRARHRGRDRHARDQDLHRRPTRSPTPTRDPARRARRRSRSAASPCRLVQLVPNAFVVRMSSALDELGSELPPVAEPPRRGVMRSARRGARPRRRSRASRCASGPSSAARGCPPPRWSGCRPARWSSSTSRPTSRSTCTSTAHASPPAAWWWWTEPTGPCASRRVLRPRDTSNESEDGGGPMARILVVDDAAFMRKMVSDALTKGGHEVVGEAGNGIEAVARFQELKPELTTLDITMPEKDGLAALQGDHRARSVRARDHVLGAGPGVQGARVDQARREGLRRQAVPGRARARGRRQGARLAQGPSRFAQVCRSK